MTGVFGRRQVRISNADRAAAVAKVDAMLAQGLIRGDAEANLRKQKINAALYKAELDEALAHLPRQLKVDDPLASDGDREDAIRRVRFAEGSGYLTSDEADIRVVTLRECRTQASIAAVVADLPSLEQPDARRKISDRDRTEAQLQIIQARVDGRITESEAKLASVQVERARSRAELNQAFRGLTNPRVEETRKKLADAGKASVGIASEGARRVRSAILRLLVSIFLLIAGVVVLIAGSNLLGWLLITAALFTFGSVFMALLKSRT